MKTVMIFWQSRITGYCGNGSNPLPKNVAEDMVRELNKEFTELTHWCG